MRASLTLSLVAILILTSSGCARKEDPQDLEEKTAQATAALKSNAKAMAEGVKEGWNRDKPLDLNAATRADLLSLPGLTAQQADRIIAGRPYAAKTDLTTRGILPKAEYEQISDRITVKKQ